MWLQPVKGGWERESGQGAVSHTAPRQLGDPRASAQHPRTACCAAGTASWSPSSALTLSESIQYPYCKFIGISVFT